MNPSRHGRLILLLFIACAGMVLTGFLMSSSTAQRDPVEPAVPPMPPTSQRDVDLGSERERSLEVFVQQPASLLPGRTRQVRVTVADRPERSIRQTSDPEQLLEVELSLETTDEAAGLVSIDPGRVLVRRGELHWARFELGAVVAIPCDTTLGDLRVSVREINEEGASGETVVALPPIDCRDRPPGPPDALHVTDPVCGSDWRDLVEAIVDGEEPPPEEACERFDDDGEPLPIRRPPRSPATSAPEPPSEPSDEEAPPEEPSEAPPEADTEPPEPEEPPAEEPAEQAPPPEEPDEEPAPEEPPEEAPPGDEPPDESSEEPAATPPVEGPGEGASE